MTLKTTNLRAHAALSVLLGLGLIWVPRVSAQSLTDGPGKAQLQTACTACHGLDKVTAKGRRTAGQWRGVVALMRAYGAMGSNEDFAAILRYLNANLGRMPTAEEAAEEGVDGAPPAKEPSAKLPLEQMRDLSGPWMTSMWYTVLNMGPRGSLPTQQPQMHGVKDPEAPVPSLFTPWAKAIVAKYSMYTDPVLTCNSPGPQAYAAPYAFEIIPSPGRLNMLMEYYHVVRRVYMDGREHPKGNPNPNAIGHSIGHWEGETLVVDTVGFNDSPVQQMPHSDELHLVERMRRIRDGNVLEIEVTQEDPKAYTQPLTQTMYFKRDPSLEMIEHNCDGELDYSSHAPKPAVK